MILVERLLEASRLRPGDPHYRAYVGPPEQYDFMGATQFRLLCTLGLRASHRLLDFGCGSLRAGRLFLSYLEPGLYCGVEPNHWLIEDAIAKEIGRDLIDLKKPRFAHNSDFDASVFDQEFDFVLAQSVLSHTGPDLVAKALRSFRDALAPEGLIAATFLHGEKDCDAAGWFYPGGPHNRKVTYRPASIRGFAREAGLFIRPIPWYHPRQSWYLLARSERRLPTDAMMIHLSGAVLFDSSFADSLKPRRRPVSPHALMRRLARRLRTP